MTLERVHRGTLMIWLFSPDMLEEIPAVYDEFSSPWIAYYMPHVLLRRGWLGVPLWQWILLALGVALSILAAAATRPIAIPVPRRLFHSIADEHDEWLLDQLTGPLRGLVSLLVLELLFPCCVSALFSRAFRKFPWMLRIRVGRMAVRAPDKRLRQAAGPPH